MAPPPSPLARLRWQTLFVFLISSAVYFLARSPALDEWDSVQFAQGVGDFNLWQHRPHPPGYPLYVLAGWAFSHALPLDVPDALHLASALGGGLFMACWFALSAQAFGRFVAAGCALALGALLILWMSATKALTDPSGAGLLALTLLLLRNRRPIPAAAAAALAVGVRPQNFAVMLLVMMLGIAWTRAPRRRWASGLGVFAGVCLLWLLPTMWLQAHTPESGGRLLAYPQQLVNQWRWRLDKPGVFIGAAKDSRALPRRYKDHVESIRTRGFGFARDSVWGWIGTDVIVLGWVFYLLERRRPAPPASLLHWPFWREHLPWAAAYAGMVFCCLPGDQRYYLPIYPLLLLPALLGWAGVVPTPRGRWLMLAVPAVNMIGTLPFVVENHRELPLPMQMIRLLQARHPAAERARVCLILHDPYRHVQWYAPEFCLVNAVPDDPTLPPGTGLPPQPLAVYTDEPPLATPLLPPGLADGKWRLTASFLRSPLIYRKHSFLFLYRLNLPPHDATAPPPP